MANYGLIPSSDVAGSGNPGSSYFLKADEPIAIVSPLTVVSADGADTGVISVANSGDMSIESSTVPSTLLLQSNGNGSFFGGVVGIGNPNIQTSLVVNVPVDGSLQGAAFRSADVNTIIGASTGTNHGSIQVTSGGVAGGIGTTPFNLDLNPLGGSVLVGSASTVGGAILEVTGTLGGSRVNDPVYNPVIVPVIVPVTQVAITAILSGTATGPLGTAFLTGTGSPITVVAGGAYIVAGQFQCSVTAAAGPGFAVSVAIDNGGSDVSIQEQNSNIYNTTAGALSAVNTPFSVVCVPVGTSIQLFVAISNAAGALESCACSVQNLVVTRIA